MTTPNDNPPAAPAAEPAAPAVEPADNPLASSLFGGSDDPFVDDLEPIDSPENDLPTPKPAAPASPANVAPVPAQQSTQQAPAAPAPAQSTVQPAPQNQLSDAEVQAFRQWQMQQQQVAQQRMQQPSGQVPEPKQPTQEEIDAQLNRFKVTDQVFDGIFEAKDKAQAMSALDQFGQGLVKQAVTMAYHLMQDSQQRLQQQVQPYMQFADSQRDLMMREAFFASHPDLKGMDVLVNTAMQQLMAEKQQGQFQPKSDKEIFDAVAKRANDLRNAVVGGQTQPAGSQQQVIPNGQPVPAQRPGMVQMPRGSQGGAPSAPGRVAAGQNPTAASLFG